jgi:molecular chaperone GrpE
LEEKDLNVEEIINEDTVNNEENIDVEELDSKDVEIQTLKDSLQRLQADFNNFRRRTQQEKESLSIYANEKMVMDLLPVIDNMERALEACDDKESDMYKGIELVYKQLKDTLSKFSVEEIAAQDEEFDPNLHMAVMQEPAEGVEPNKVIQVLQKGYKLSSRVIRPSMVKVSC